MLLRDRVGDAVRAQCPDCVAIDLIDVLQPGALTLISTPLVGRALCPLGGRAPEFTMLEGAFLICSAAPPVRVRVCVCERVCGFELLSVYAQPIAGVYGRACVHYVNLCVNHPETSDKQAMHQLACVYSDASASLRIH
jgi:hypothetical protein